MWFLVGVVVTAFGIAFITKASLGTTPITSLSYVASFRFPPSIGAFTFVLNFLFIVLQAVLLRRRFPPIQWLQLLVNVIFSGFIDISLWALGWMNPEAMWLQLLVVVIGCTILAFGIALQVSPGVLVVPGEGAVKAIAIVTKVRFGTVKVIFDWTLITIAAICSFAFFGELRGIGLGTVITALLVGSIANIYFRRLFWLGTLNPPPPPRLDE